MWGTPPLKFIRPNIPQVVTRAVYYKTSSQESSCRNWFKTKEKTQVRAVGHLFLADKKFPSKKASTETQALSLSWLKSPFRLAIKNSMRLCIRLKKNIQTKTSQVICTPNLSFLSKKKTKRGRRFWTRQNWFKKNGKSQRLHSLKSRKT